MKSLNKIYLLIASSFVALSLMACGDDSSGAGESPEVNHETVTVVDTDSIGFYNSVKELPKCVDSLSNVFYKVKDDYYACYNRAWEKLSSLAQGICNITECSSKSQGKLVYAKLNRTVYQCSDGEWLDQEGQGFSEKDFVSCYVDALVKNSAKKVSELPKCTSDDSHDISKVADDLFVCYSKRWSELAGEVVSEQDLPACKKDSAFVFVLSKMKAYVCSEGKWYCDDKVVALSSSSDKISSSASTQENVVLDSAALKDTVKVRGICMPSVSQAERGEQVSWRFINLGGNPYTYDWNLEADSVSHKAAPKVSYTKSGQKRVSLVVNQGLKSQSDEIICSNLEILKSTLSGCTCVLDNKTATLTVDEFSPDSLTWSVKNCEGGDDLFYRWSVSGWIGPSMTVSATGSSSVTPSVVVQNADGSTMNVRCQTGLFKGVPKAQCSVYQSPDALSFSAQDFVNVSGGSVEMTVVGSDGYSEQVTANPNGLSLNRWNIIEFEKPSSSSEEIESSDSEEPSSSETLEESSSSEEIEDASSSSEEEPDSSESMESSDSGEIESSDSEGVESSDSEEMESSDSEKPASSESQDESSDSKDVAEVSSDSEGESDGGDPVGEIVNASSRSRNLVMEPLMAKQLTYEEFGNGVYSYSLVYGKDTLCRASTISCHAELDSYYSAHIYGEIQRGEAVVWRIDDLNGYEVSSYHWTFSDGMTSTDASPKRGYVKGGTVGAKVVLNKGQKTEQTVYCKEESVARSGISGCSCGDPKLISSSDDLADGPVSYKWTVEGCVSDDGNPLSYNWHGYKITGENSATGTFIARGSIGPVVTVSNADGVSVSVTCKAVFLNDSKNPLKAVNLSRDVLEPGDYVLEHCSVSSSGTRRVRVRSSLNCSAIFVNGFEKFNSYSGNYEECDGEVSTEIPVYFTVPKNGTVQVENCY